MDNNLKLGHRILYDQDGDIIYILWEVEGHVNPRKELTSINYIDLEFGQLDISKYIIKGVNLETLEPILEELPSVETEEQRRIRELEDALLLQAEADIGGIL